MKLAEALQERAELNRRIGQIQTRLENNCFTQKGEPTAEDPSEILAELDSVTARLEVLIAAINLANSTTMVDGQTLTQIIARKDALGQQIGVLRRVIEAASGAITRYTRTEIKIIRTVDVAALQVRADSLSKEVRMLDNRLQQANWETEIKL